MGACTSYSTLSRVLQAPGRGRCAGGRWARERDGMSLFRRQPSRLGPRPRPGRARAAAFPFRSARS
eukprot:6200093-Prymnesium_polylepis.1